MRGRSIPQLLHDVEPWWTMIAGVPPWDLRRLSLRQMHRHMTWWDAGAVRPAQHQRRLGP